MPRPAEQPPRRGAKPPATPKARQSGAPASRAGAPGAGGRAAKPAAGGRSGTPTPGGRAGKPTPGGRAGKPASGRGGKPAGATYGRGAATSGSGTGGTSAPRPARADRPRADGTRTERPRAGGTRPQGGYAGREAADQPRGRGAPDRNAAAGTSRTPPRPAAARPGAPERARTDARASDRPARVSDGPGRADRADRSGDRTPGRTTGRAADASRTRTPRPAGGTGTGRAAPPRTGRPAPSRTTGPTRDERPQRLRPPTGPALPPDADPRLLPADVRRELRALQNVVADRVAAHLVAAGQLLDEDAAAAYEHAKAAKALAGRIGAVREAVGVTAYAAGDYATALAELKAARRITGLPDHLPLIADAERAVGHPERAVAAGNDPDRARLDRAGRIELAIVVSGARRDLGQPEAAVLALQGPELDSDAVEEWTVRLWYAYADALLAAGRTEDAAHWFTAVAAVDEDGETDAGERLAQL